MPPKPVTAALLVIGDEILSGRTKDKNIGFAADFLTERGIDLREVRVVPDVIDEIVAALNALRHRYSYVFTTGGIGPTHDDVTVDAVGAAFGVPVAEDPRAIELLLQRIKPEDLNAARRRMARMPPAPNSSRIRSQRRRVSGSAMSSSWPACRSIMQAMLAAVAPEPCDGAAHARGEHRCRQYSGRRLCRRARPRSRRKTRLSRSALIHQSSTANSTTRSSYVARMPMGSPPPSRRSKRSITDAAR